MTSTLMLINTLVYNQQEYLIDEPMAADSPQLPAADLKPQLEKNGFRESVLVQSWQTLDETRWLLARRTPIPSFLSRRLGRSAFPRFARRNWNRRRKSKTRRIRHIVQSEPDNFLLQPRFFARYFYVGEFDLAYDILVYARNLPIAAEFVKRFPGQRLSWTIWQNPRSRVAH